MCQILNESVGENLNGSVEYEAPETPMTDEQIAVYSAALYAGIVTQYNLSVEQYVSTARYLVSGLNEGFEDVYSPLYKSLEQSLYHFSAAKQYTQNRHILSNFVAPLEEYSYNEFKDVADQILHDYNKAYLRTEWNTAVANSQSARDWDMLMQDDTIEFIEYRTQEDGRVRPEHAALNLARYPKKSSFWNNYFPPNGWNCRCFTVNYDENTEVNPIVDAPDFGTNEMPTIFKHNPGKEKIIFPNAHPYFRVAQGDKVFREANYGMPMP